MSRNSTVKKKKVIVAMSGGVDSSVSAALLKKAGFDVIGIFMKCWSADDPMGENCTSSDDERMARLAAHKIGIPFYSINLIKEYRQRVVQYLLDGYKKGITPNPDIMCNKEIKFGLFFDKAMELGVDYVATGHYARVHKGSIFMAKDQNKDQSYFLSFIKPEVLDKVMFPIGDYTKPEVRKLAKKFGLPNAERKDSQGICFLGKIPFDKFLEYHLGKRPGKLIEYETRKVLGEHSGFWYFTVGQRRGIKLSGGPWYVVAKNPETNEVFISHGEHHEELARDSFIVSGLNWIAGAAPEKTKLSVKIRHGAKLYPATVEFLENDKLKVSLKEKDQGIASGQFAVFYDGEYCLGGGVISG